jgi:hypothetical protein
VRRHDDFYPQGRFFRHGGVMAAVSTAIGQPLVTFQLAELATTMMASTPRPW